MALSPADSSRLEALVDAPSIASYAKSNNLPLTNLALWLQRPEIAEAHQALLQLKALDRRHHNEQIADEALEVLRETMHASEDPVERRRCANTILRAIARTNRPQQSRGREHAEGAPTLSHTPQSTHTANNRARSASEGPPQGGPALRAGSPPSTPSSVPTSDHSVSSSLSLAVSDPQASSPKPQASPSPASTHPSSFSLHPSALPPYDFEAAAARAEARQTALRTNPTYPEILQAINANKAAPTPDDFAKTPESCTDLAALRLAATPNPTGNRLFLAIYDALDIDLRMNARTWDPCKRALEASPFVTCKEDDGWTRTDHPVEHQQAAKTATRKYTFTNETTGETKTCTLALSHRAPHFPDPTHWWITHILTPPNTS